MIHGTLKDGRKAITPIPVPPSRVARLVLVCDNDLQNLLPAELRVAVFWQQAGWRVKPYLLDGGKGPLVIDMFDPRDLPLAASVRREDEGDVSIAWAVM